MLEIFDEIALKGLKIGNNWLIIQNGTDLWVQNFPNATAGNMTNQTAGAANATNQTAGGANETQPAANATETATRPPSEGFLGAGNETAPA